MIDFDEFDPGPPTLPDERYRGSMSEELVQWIGQQLKTPWWHKSAACLGTDSTLFFQGRGGTSQPAKALCAQCSVAGACLDWALSQGEGLQGIWGGMSPRERRAEKRRRLRD